MGLVGCDSGWTQYGEATDIDSLQAEAMGVSAGLSQGAGAVVVKGQIGEVCDVGCWFYLMDDESLVLVHRGPGQTFVIPQDARGRQAVVQGHLEGEGESLQLAARSVGILD